MLKHALAEKWLEAEKVHSESHRQMGSWAEIEKTDPRVRKKQILGCMWVYTYKFDKHGKFRKCKARLVVRGDKQIKSGYEDTYASTLAGRSFRSLIAIAARFDLELIQYDAVNAFVHARLDHDVFMQLPAGYPKDGVIAKLERALYSLRESPLLWQRDFSSSLEEIGFQPMPHKPCCMVKDGIIIFYYIDDIVLAFRKDKRDDAAKLMRKLQ